MTNTRSSRSRSNQDRILNPHHEFSPLFSASSHQTGHERAQEFWDQYFELQDMVESVYEHDGSFTLQVTNHQTGETVSMQNVRLVIDESAH